MSYFSRSILKLRSSVYTYVFNYYCRLLAETGLLKGRSFRCGWGPSSVVSCLTTRRNADRLALCLGNRALNDYSTTLLQQVSVYSADDASFRVSWISTNKESCISIIGILTVYFSKAQYCLPNKNSTREIISKSANANKVQNVIDSGKLLYSVQINV